MRHHEQQQNQDRTYSLVRHHEQQQNQDRTYSLVRHHEQQQNQDKNHLELEFGRNDVVINYDRSMNNTIPFWSITIILPLMSMLVVIITVTLLVQKGQSCLKG